MLTSSSSGDQWTACKRQMNVICGIIIPILGSMWIAKMRGYQVIGHTDPKGSHSLAETGKEHGKEAFGMILYLK